MKTGILGDIMIVLGMLLFVYWALSEITIGRAIVFLLVGGMILVFRDAQHYMGGDN